MPARHAAPDSISVADSVQKRPDAVWDHATPGSIAAARAAQRREREDFLKWTGTRLSRDGRPLLSDRARPQRGRHD